jgi:RecB family exonuclease
MKLLAFLESALGLGGPTVTPAARIAAWRTLLDAAGGNRFWERSFAADPFSTARLLLGWRDGLVEAGWTATALSAPPPRLADLAAAELTELPVPAGLADRLVKVIASLRDGPIIGRIELIEPRALLPRGLTRLLVALEASGTQIAELSPPRGTATDDLGRVQAMLRDGSHAALQGDASFAVLSSSTETGAAEVLADWLAVDPTAEGALLIADRETSALDAALARRGLPPVGQSKQSPLRGVLQVLPLVLALRWAPFSATRMLEFLQLPDAPVAPTVRRRLIAALQEAPGHGGEVWQRAIAEGFAEEGARSSESAAAAKSRSDRSRAQIAALLEAPLLDPKQGMPIAILRLLCGLVSAWAGMRVHNDSLAITLADTADSLIEAAAATKLDPFPRLDLERLLEQVQEDGVADPDRVGAVAPWSVVNGPAALWGPAETVVWWGVTPLDRPARSPWTAEERAALDAAGCVPNDPLTTLAAETRAWRNALLHAGRRALLVVAPEPSVGTEAVHPLLQELAPLLVVAPVTNRPIAEVLLGDGHAALLGTPLPRSAVPPLLLPQPYKPWRIAPGVPLHRETESSSSLSLLLGCPYAWVAQYAARLRPGRLAALPETEQLVGTLAHALVERLFRPGMPPSSAEVRVEAIRRLDDLIAEMGAPLLAPGLAAELVRVQRDLPEATKILAELLGKHGLTVTAVEAEREVDDMPASGTRFTGRIDMLLADSQGHPVVLDLKWSRSDRYRREEVKNGAALQLAAYARLTGAGEAAGYFMLAQGRVVGRKGAIAGGSVVPAPTLADTWTRVTQAVERRKTAIGEGRLHALGLDYNRQKPPPDPDEIKVAISPPCHFCKFGRLCGVELIR